jgi:hypothetical protein
MSTISNRIRQLENRSISAYRFAKTLQLTTNLQQEHTGDNTWKSADLIKITDYFKVSLDWL